MSAIVDYKLIWCNKNCRRIIWNITTLIKTLFIIFYRLKIIRVYYYLPFSPTSYVNLFFPLFNLAWYHYLKLMLRKTIYRVAWYTYICHCKRSLTLYRDRLAMISVVNMKNIRGKFHGKTAQFRDDSEKKTKKRYFCNYNIIVFE